jgi:hypothetical protein
MKIIRHLCDAYPAHRKLFIGLGYALVVLGGGVWYVFLLVPAVALTFLDPSHFLLVLQGVPVASPRVLMVLSWFLTLLGLGLMYLGVRELRKLRLQT